MYIWNAELYCDSCGESLSEHLGDAGETPQWAEEGETDGPDHCAGGATCLERVDLRDYGLALDAPLYGAESVPIGAPLGFLTEEGRRYMEEMVSEEDPTPYQSALYRLWEEVYG